MTGDNCNVCRFARMPTGKNVFLACRRNPPPWPAVFADGMGWCGEFRHITPATEDIIPFANALADAAAKALCVTEVEFDRETIFRQDAQQLRTALANYRNCLAAAGRT